MGGRGHWRKLAAAAALTLASQATEGQAMTPALLDPARLAGAWTLTGPGGKSCRLELKAEAAAGAPGLALDVRDCARAGLPVARANHWRVSSDGLAFAAADRATVLFFSAQGGDRFEATTRDGVRFSLERARGS